VIAGFAELGAASEAVVSRGRARHPAMHRTRSVDYGIVLEGEIWLILDEEETLLRAGDVCIQRATNHAWSNRSDRRCVMAFVLLDGSADH
jgi:quercetin dioxygenase-like cupin family protein